MLGPRYLFAFHHVPKRVALRILVPSKDDPFTPRPAGLFHSHPVEVCLRITHWRLKPLDKQELVWYNRMSSGALCWTYGYSVPAAQGLLAHAPPKVQPGEKRII